MSKYRYESDIKLGEKYYSKDHDEISGIAVGVYFYRNACERVSLEYFNEVEGKLEDVTFDAVELIEAKTQETARSPLTGGPRGRTSPERRR